MIANSQQRRQCLRQTSGSFFLERASTSNFCCATDQNNPHILKYVSYDWSCLLQPCGKLFSWAPPVSLGNFYPLVPHPLGISLTIRGGGGGVWIFSEITQCSHELFHTIFPCTNMFCTLSPPPFLWRCKLKPQQNGHLKKPIINLSCNIIHDLHDTFSERCFEYKQTL